MKQKHNAMIAIAALCLSMSSPCLTYAEPGNTAVEAAVNAPVPEVTGQPADPAATTQQSADPAAAAPETAAPETAPQESAETPATDTAADTTAESSTQAAETTAQETAEKTTAAIDEDTGITVAEEEAANFSNLDSEGYCVFPVTFPENTVFPMTVVLKDESGTKYTLIIEKDGQKIRLKPGTYTVTSVKDGNGKHLDKGATMEVTDNIKDPAYLDFTMPEDAKSGISWVSLIKTNLLTLCIIAVIAISAKYYIKHNGINR